MPQESRMPARSRRRPGPPPWRLSPLLLLLSGCMAGGSTWRPAEAAFLETPGTRIVAEDGSFSFEPGQEIRTPFMAFDCPARPTSRNADLGERLGGQRVRIHHPAFDEPLYGILSFCWVHSSVRGPTSRMYRLAVPAYYVEQTSSGRISVVHEPSGYKAVYEDGEHEIPAWALWLSRTPFQRP
jgi:hypothetical protein